MKINLIDELPRDQLGRWKRIDKKTPKDGKPIFIKMEVIFTGWHVLESGESKWIFDSDRPPNGILTHWVDRKSSQNYYDLEERAADEDQSAIIEQTLS